MNLTRRVGGPLLPFDECHNGFSVEEYLGCKPNICTRWDPINDEILTIDPYRDRNVEPLHGSH